MTSTREARRDAERVALKEWAVLVSAMARGDLIAMIRKGGIREHRAGFDVRHDRFLLYPTFFHEKLNELDARFHPTLESVHADAPPDRNHRAPVRRQCRRRVAGDGARAPARDRCRAWAHVGSGGVSFSVPG